MLAWRVLPGLGSVLTMRWKLDDYAPETEEAHLYPGVQFEIPACFVAVLNRRKLSA